MIRLFYDEIKYILASLLCVIMAEVIIIGEAVSILLSLTSIKVVAVWLAIVFLVQTGLLVLWATKDYMDFLKWHEVNP